METLDLHGVKHQDAVIIAEDFMLLNEPPFQIITGNSPQMKKIVIDLLKKHDYKYKYPHEHNMGALIIYA